MALHVVLVSYCNSFTALFSFLRILEVCGVWIGLPCTPLSAPASFVQGTLTQALNAGHRRLLTKLRERGGGFVCVKAVHAIKNSLPLLSMHRH